MSLTAQEYLNLGGTEFDSVHGLSETADKRAAFRTAAGYFELAQREGPLEAEVYGYLAEFRIAYSIFLHGEGRDRKSAQKQYKLARKYLRTAVKLDRNDWTARMTLFRIDVADLDQFSDGSPKQITLLVKMFRNLAYSNARGRVSASTQALATAFEVQLKPKTSISLLLDLIDEAFSVINIVVDQKANFMPLYRAFLKVKAPGQDLSIYAETEEEEKDIENQYALTVGRVMASIAEFESRSKW